MTTSTDASGSGTSSATRAGQNIWYPVAPGQVAALRDVLSRAGASDR